MAKKDLVHEGKRSWWDGSVTSLCGLRFEASSKPEFLWFTSVTCPACKAAMRRRK
jgi:hypothetical protein